MANTEIRLIILFAAKDGEVLYSQQKQNWELTVAQILIAKFRLKLKKVRGFQKNINFCFIDYVKAFDCVDNNKLWKILKEMGISDHLICL